MVLDRQIRSIQREEFKVKQELKKNAKRGDRDVCVVLAKEILNARKAVEWICFFIFGKFNSFVPG